MFNTKINFLFNVALRDVVLMYKQLNTSGTNGLSLEEFYSIYDANELLWEAQFSKIPWFHASWEPIQVICRFCNNLTNWSYFEHIICKYLFHSMINCHFSKQKT